MEGEPTTGAGPESTGIENIDENDEQLRLFGGRGERINDAAPFTEHEADTASFAPSRQRRERAHGAHPHEVFRTRRLDGMCARDHDIVWRPQDAGAAIGATLDAEGGDRD